VPAAAVVAMNRGIIWLTEEDLADLLYIPGSLRIVGFVAKPERGCMGVILDGEGLPSVARRAEAPTLPLSPYVDLDLRPKLAALIERYNGEDERYGPGAGDFAECVLRILSGDLDPRTDMPPLG
jgi:hypothetical protein